MVWSSLSLAIRLLNTKVSFVNRGRALQKLNLNKYFLTVQTFLNNEFDTVTMASLLMQITDNIITAFLIVLMRKIVHFTAVAVSAVVAK